MRVPLKLKFYNFISKFIQQGKTPNFSMDAPKRIRKGEELALDKLKKYLSNNNIEANELLIKQFPSGYSNLTYFLKSSTQEFVLRRPPFGVKSLQGGHDMFREYNVLKNLKSQFAKVPDVYLYCDDSEIIGAPFYLMERVEGYIIRPNLQQKDAPKKEIIQNVSKSLVSSLVELHNINIEQANLNDLGNINGYIKRQVEGWIKRYNHSKTDSLQNMDFIASWLIENQPLEVKGSIVHNDFKYDNLVLNKDDHSKITAILDWEMATIGDPFMDLGTSLGYWVDKNDLPELKLFQLSATTLDGNPTREGILELYEQKSGKSIINPVFYYVFGLFKIAVIVQQIFFRYKNGFTKDTRFKNLDQVVKAYLFLAIKSIEKQKIEL